MEIEDITSALPELINPIAIPDSTDTLKASAVLMVLHQTNQQWNLLLTTRARHLKSHAGQISFPGGRFETDDQHLMETAIRETEEEIGVTRKHLQVFSQLNEQPTLTGYRIFPYIAFATNLPNLTIDAGEVDDAFSVPLHYLLDSRNQQSESAYYNNKNYNYYKIVWQDKMIWGATARMIVDFSKFFKDITTT